jgi:hypothetical protein
VPKSSYMTFSGAHCEIFWIAVAVLWANRFMAVDFCGETFPRPGLPAPVVFEKVDGSSSLTLTLAHSLLVEVCGAFVLSPTSYLSNLEPAWLSDTGPKWTVVCHFLFLKVIC